MSVRSAIEHRVASPDAAATHALGVALAGVARPGDLVCLWGELGAGKTVFAKGFGVGLGATTTVASPSFILMAEHVGRLPLFHLDLYRLGGPSDVLAGGLLDDRQAAGVTLVEWPDRLGTILPRERVDVVIEASGEVARSIVVRAEDPDLSRYVEAARRTAAR